MTKLVSWSGGKDSCLAYWRARQAGADVRLLVTAMDEAGARSRSHGVPPSLIRAQADALGLPLRFYDTSWATYEDRFVQLLREARAEGIDGAIFGDIDLQPHRDWEEKVCAAAGLTAQLPLWGQARRALVDEFLAAGFKAVVVCVNGNYLGAEWCRREFDADFLAELPPHVDACGENGEFHTFVYDGPCFRRPVPMARGPVVQWVAPPEMGSWTYWFQSWE
jgi:uncharacterized protein (TIGR00290 family)